MSVLVSVYPADRSLSLSPPGSESSPRWRAVPRPAAPCRAFLSRASRTEGTWRRRRGGAGRVRHGEEKKSPGSEKWLVILMESLACQRLQGITGHRVPSRAGASRAEPAWRLSVSVPSVMKCRVSALEHEHENVRDTIGLRCSGAKPRVKRSNPYPTLQPDAMLTLDFPFQRDTPAEPKPVSSV